MQTAISSDCTTGWIRAGNAAPVSWELEFDNGAELWFNTGEHFVIPPKSDRGALRFLSGTFKMRSLARGDNLVLRASRDESAVTPSAQTSAEFRMEYLARGLGRNPTERDKVRVHWTTWANGQFVQTTRDVNSSSGGQPLSLRPSGTIQCVHKALLEMRAGEKVKVTCPPELAYGSKEIHPDIPAGAVLTIEIELLDSRRSQANSNETSRLLFAERLPGILRSMRRLQETHRSMSMANSRAW